MFNKRNLILIPACLCFSLFICSCELIGVNEVKINDDGSGTVCRKVLMDSELLNAFENSDYDIFSDSESDIASFESEEGEAEDRDKDNDESEGDYDKVEFMDEEYTLMEEETLDFDDIDELEDILDEMDVLSDYEITPDSFRCTCTPTEEDSSADSSDNAFAEIIENGGTVKIYLTISFEDEIRDTNGELSEDGMSVTWELSDYDEETEIYAVAGSNTLLIILLIAGGIILVGGIIIAIIVIRNKKNASDI